MLLCTRGFFGRLKQKFLRLFRLENRYSPNALVDALQQMDNPGDWDRLMVIGHELGKQYRSRIEDWVDAWVVGKSVVPPLPGYVVPELLEPAVQKSAAVVVEEEVLLTMVVEPAVATKAY